MRHRRPRLPVRAARALTVTLVALLTIAAPAAATPGPDRPVHCVLDLSAGSAGGGWVCTDSFREAIAYATDGRVGDAPEQAADLAGDPRLTVPEDTSDAVEGPAVSVVLAIDYSDRDFGGSTLTLTGATACDASADLDFQFGTLPPGWNDQISSFRGFNRCEQLLFRDVFYDGELTGIISTTAWVGAAANDKASSIRMF